MAGWKAIVGWPGNPMRSTVLIIHPGALGDTLLSLPALRLIQRRYPTHHLGFLAKRDVGDLLRDCGEVHTVFPLEGEHLAGLLAGPDAVRPALRCWLSYCDLAVGWMKDPEDRLASTLRGLGVARVLIKSPAESGAADVHQAERFLHAMAELWPAVLIEAPLHVSESAIAKARAQLSQLGFDSLQRFIVLHPGSGSSHKCASPALFGMLVDHLAQQGWATVLVEGPADGEVLTKVLRICSSRPPILQGLDLLTMAGVLALSALFIGHDSGLTHLAAALHIPIVAIFGPTDVRRWGPLGPQVHIVTGKPCHCRGWEEIQACLAKPCLTIPFESLLKVVSGRLNE